MTHIFLLEDEKLLGETYSDYLEHKKHTVFWAKNFLEAFEIIQQKKKIDIAFLDHIIADEPEYGEKLIPALREKFPHIHITLLSNYNMAHMLEERMKADEYVMKMNMSLKDLAQYISHVA
jgi:CheY-like chemotaxis protein